MISFIRLQWTGVMIIYVTFKDICCITVTGWRFTLVHIKGKFPLFSSLCANNLPGTYWGNFSQNVDIICLCTSRTQVDGTRLFTSHFPVIWPYRHKCLEISDTLPTFVHSICFKFALCMHCVFTGTMRILHGQFSKKCRPGILLDQPSWSGFSQTYCPLCHWLWCIPKVQKLSTSSIGGWVEKMDFAG